MEGKTTFNETLFEHPFLEYLRGASESDTIPVLIAIDMTQAIYLSCFELFFVGGLDDIHIGTVVPTLGLIDRGLSMLGIL